MLFDFDIKKELNVNLVSLKGELIAREQALPLTDEIQKLLQNKELKFVFDLKDLKYMNSSGLNILINLYSKVRKTGGDIIIANVNSKINELLVITKLTSMFSVTDSIPKAIAKLK